MNDELEKSCKHATVDYYRIAFQKISGGAEEDLVISWPADNNLPHTLQRSKIYTATFGAGNEARSPCLHGSIIQTFFYSLCINIKIMAEGHCSSIL